MNDKWFDTLWWMWCHRICDSTIAIGNPSNSVNGVFDTQCVLQFEMFVTRACIPTASNIEMEKRVLSERIPIFCCLLLIRILQHYIRKKSGSAWTKIMLILVEPKFVVPITLKRNQTRGHQLEYLCIRNIFQRKKTQRFKQNDSPHISM